MSFERSATISYRSFPSTSASSVETLGRPSTAPRFDSPESRYGSSLDDKAIPGVSALLHQHEHPTSPPLTSQPGTEERWHRRPPPLALHPPVTASPLKRSADHFDRDDHEDLAQAEAGFSRDFGELSTADISVCQPLPSAKRPPRPRNKFILYRQITARDLAQKNPGMSVPDASKLAGAKWHALPEEEKQHWARLAKEEERAHAERYPDYRYRPRKNHRNSIAQSPSSLSCSQCTTCGKYPMVNTPSPEDSEYFRSSMTPRTPKSASFTFGNRQLPPMQVSSLASSTRRDSTRHNSTDIHIPPINTNTSYSGRESVTTPDLKRRRFLNGSVNPLPTPITHQQPFNVGSPHRGSFAYANGPPVHTPGVRPQMPPPAHPYQINGPILAPGVSPVFAPPQGHPMQGGLKRMSGSLARPDDDGLILPRDQHSGKTLEEILRSESVREPFRVLNTVLHHSTPESNMRGVAVAVEGDNLAAVQGVAQFLHAQLSDRPEFSVRLAEGPEGPAHDTDANLRDYFLMMATWHEKAQEMAHYLASADSDQAQHETSDAHKPTPIILLNRYAYHAAISWASRYPFRAPYEAKQHWIWFATTWRDIIAPSLTVFLRDVSAEHLAGNKAVEICEEAKLIFVLREKSETAEVDETTLRRLEFEVTEWVRHVVAEKRRTEGKV